jgi:acetylornithine deacetylase/succinyl-diaminopimelate desuccinylase-like protein
MTQHSDFDSALGHAEAHLDDALDRLLALMRVPSISTDPAYAEHCQHAARLLSDELTELGFDARVAPTPGHPMVVAHHDGDGTTSSRSIRSSCGAGIRSTRCWRPAKTVRR